MAKKKKESKSIDKWKKKKWYPLIAPRVFKGSVIGETPAAESKLVLGRELTLSMMSLANDVKKQNVRVSFIVEKMNGEQAITEVKGITLQPSFVKRIVRRGKDRIDEVLSLKTADNVHVLIKPILVTASNTSSLIKRKLRKYLAQEVKNKAESLNYSELISKIVYKRFQSEVYGSLKKIYPISTVEIRLIQVVSFKERTSEVVVRRERIENPRREFRETPKETKETKEMKVDKKTEIKDSKKESEESEESEKIKEETTAKKTEETEKTEVKLTENKENKEDLKRMKDTDIKKEE